MPVDPESFLRRPLIRLAALLVWISNPAEDRRISSDLRFEIDRRFRAAGIEIPFPQRDVHVRSLRADGAAAG